MLDIKLKERGSNNYIRIYEEKAPSAGEYELKEEFVYPDKMFFRRNTIFTSYKKGDKTARKLVQCAINNYQIQGYYK